jgi:hypothetical protein
MASAATTRRISAGLAAAALLSGCGSEAAPKRDAAGAIEQAGETRLLSLHTGDCVGNLRDRLDNPDGGHNGVPKVKAVKCSSTHDAELVKIARLDDGEWPGFVIVDGEAARGRLQLAVRLARVKAVDGAIKIVSFRPTRERWNFEHQRAIYYLILYDKPQRGPAPK